MTRSKARLVNIAVTVLSLAILLTAGGRLKAYLVSEAEPGRSAATLLAQSHRPSSEAAEHSAGAGESNAEGEGGEHASAGNPIFKWINFLLLVGALSYFVKTHTVPSLQARREGIAQEMQQSRDLIDAATRRLSAIEEKLASLDQEIASLRSSALQEASAEHARIQESVRTDSRKIAAAAEQEIAVAAKIARKELKQFAADLAVGLAEKKIEKSMSPDAERGIFRTFITGLANGSPTNGRAAQLPTGDA